MAIKRFKRDNFGNGIHSEFFIDSAEDLEVIEDIYDCELGDRAFTPTGAEYVRHSDEFDGDLWEEVSEQGNSSSGDSGDGSGGGSGTLVVNLDNDTNILDRTWQEIADADFAVVKVSAEGDTATEWVSYVGHGDDYFVDVQTPDGAVTYACDTADGYPVNTNVQ